MPVKRRVSKSRDFDQFKLEQLIDGPEASLLAGVGYFRPEVAFWRHASAAQQAEIIADMRADWIAKRATVLAAAEGKPIWAEREFG